MVFMPCSRLTFIFAVLAGLDNVSSAPALRLAGDVRMFSHGGLQPAAPQAVDPSLDNTTSQIVSRELSAPYFVVYTDSFTPGVMGPPNVSQVKGFNVVALSFLLVSGAFDKAQEWTQLSTGERSSIKSQYASAGIKLIVSAFGSTDAPTSSGADPISIANTMAGFVKQFDLDGIDVDYEDFNAINSGDGRAESWLTTFTQQLRSQLPQGQYIITHAPVAPWFSPNFIPSGAYVTVNRNVGTLIDWYNVQFYNQGTTEYTTCSGLLTQSSNVFPKSSVFEIAASGVDLNKIVIGKPGVPSDASNGYISPGELSGCLSQAKQQGWSAGVMSWEYPSADTTWISTVRAQAFP